MAKVRNPLPVTVDWQGTNRREVYLDSLVKTNNWTIGCEVGVRTGRTLFYLLDNNPTLKMYAVDIDISQFYDEHVKEKYAERLIVLEDQSWNCASKIDQVLDFVFIDAGHSTKSVTKDINAYLPLLKNKTGLTGHDVDFPAIQAALSNLNIEFDVGPDNVWIAKN